MILEQPAVKSVRSFAPPAVISQTRQIGMVLTKGFLCRRPGRSALDLFDLFYLFYPFENGTAKETDKFLILASDGVWEFVSSEEAVKIVHSSLDQGTMKVRFITSLCLAMT